MDKIDYTNIEKHFSTYYDPYKKKGFSYSPNTIKSYIAKYRLLNNPYHYKRQITEKYVNDLVLEKKLNARVYLSALKTISEVVPEYHQYISPEMNLYISEVIDNLNTKARGEAYERTKLRENNDLTMNDLQNIILNIKDKTSQDYLLLKLYQEYPARDDFGDLFVMSEKTRRPINSYSVRSNTITLNKYKTANLYGKQTKKLSLELGKLIRASLKKEPREYLFTKPDGSQYKDGLLSNHMLKVFNFGVNEIRRAHINRLLSTEHSLEDREVLAKEMMSSVNQQEFTYKRS
tara:strand:+ start:5007 stop:5876 length:870 start_codon:yes stop_codon:yes gene_type:complete